jgi:serine/threonine protein kinase
MGVVYAARDEKLRRRVALKVLDVADQKGQLAQRLIREAQVLAQLEHPGIVPVHDVGTLEDGRVFYIMKFVVERSSMIQDGTPVEMITMYYLDGDQVKMTHYCEARNQPTMRGTYVPETKTLTFDFVGATNMKSPDDGHMHHAIYTFVDNDHVRQVWTFRKNQKDAFTEDTTFVRK